MKNQTHKQKIPIEVDTFARSHAHAFSHEHAFAGFTRSQVHRFTLTHLNAEPSNAVSTLRTFASMIFQLFNPVG